MAKRLAAGALLALALIWAVSASPLARAGGRTARDEEILPENLAEAPAEPEAESGLIPVELIEPAAGAEDWEAVEAPDVPEEGLDAARWALCRELLAPREDGRFGEILEAKAGCTIFCHFGPNTLGLILMRK